MIFRSQYGDGKIINCNVIIPKYNSDTYKHEMWISYDGKEDTFYKIAEYKNPEVINFLVYEASSSKYIIFDLEEGSLFAKSNHRFARNIAEYIKEHF